MNIAETVTFGNDGRVERFPLFRKLFLALVILLVASLSFGLGRLTGNSRGDIRLEYDPEIFNSQFPISNEATASKALNYIENSKLKIENSTSVVASSKSTKYHYPHCPGAKQISEANKLFFGSPAIAEASGYTLAGNCRAR